MPFDKITHFIFALSFICIVLTVIAISAQAEDQLPPHPDTAVTEVSAGFIGPAQALIREQLDAIKKRDAERAYELTTSGFHEKFETAKDFLGHLRMELRPVYNHENYQFIGQHNTEKGLVQKVKIEDGKGEPATVIYRLKEQTGGIWLIDSFAVLELDSDPI